MTVNNSKKEAWNKENMRTVSCRLRKEEAERFRKFAEYHGTSVHGLLAEYVRKCLALDQVIDKAERVSVNNLHNRVRDLELKLEAANKATDQARERAMNAEALVDRWLRSADHR